MKKFHQQVRQVDGEAQANLRHHFLSIYHDAMVVSNVTSYLQGFSLFANLRNGAWYCGNANDETIDSCNDGFNDDFGANDDINDDHDGANADVNVGGDDGYNDDDKRSIDGYCYFKSTDGHDQQWAFSMLRLNVHIIKIMSAMQSLSSSSNVSSSSSSSSGNNNIKGGIIVDSTRRGKAFPDSMRATIPIWMAVINYIVLGGDLANESQDLSAFFTAAPFLLKTHVSQIIERLPGFVQSIPGVYQAWIREQLAPLMGGRMLRPIWCCPCEDGTIDWLGDFADEVLSHDFSGEVDGESGSKMLPYIPIVLLSCSAVGKDGNPAEREFHSWKYIQGAADDEENWCPSGFNHRLFWKHRKEIFASDDPVVVESIVKAIVESETTKRVSLSLPIYSSSFIPETPGLTLYLERITTEIVYSNDFRWRDHLDEVGSSQFCLYIYVHRNRAFRSHVDEQIDSLGIEGVGSSINPVLNISCGEMGAQKSRQRREWVANMLREVVNFAEARLGASTFSSNSASNSSPMMILCEDAELSILIIAALLVAFYPNIYNNLDTLEIADLANQTPTRYLPAFIQLESSLESDIADGHSSQICAERTSRIVNVGKQSIRLVLVWLQLNGTSCALEAQCSRHAMKYLYAFFCCDGDD